VRARKIAWITPGTQNRTVRIKLIQKSLPRPDIKNTANGGSKIAMMIRTRVHNKGYLLSHSDQVSL